MRSFFYFGRLAKMKIPLQVSTVLLLFLTAASVAQEPPPAEPERVLVDDTGVESRFVNPVKPIRIDGRPLQFINKSDRRLVITLQVVFTGPELRADSRILEKGIEITDCESRAASTICSASATISPNQRATFSPSLLAHHPTPRIRFTVSFFGDEDVPANAVGYVTRGDAREAEEKPESQSNG